MSSVTDEHVVACLDAPTALTAWSDDGVAMVTPEFDERTGENTALVRVFTTAQLRWQWIFAAWTMNRKAV